MSSDRHGPRGLFVLIPVLLLILAMLNVRVKYLAIEPGLIEDVRGLVSVQGTQTYPPTGKLFLTTVYVRELRLVDALAGVLNPAIDVIPRSALVPPGATQEQVDQANKDDIEASKRTAEVAALSLLGYDLDLGGAGAKVTGLAKGLPAEDVLQVGDVITAINGREICGADDLQAAVITQPAGTIFKLAVARKGGTAELAIASVQADSDPAIAIIGVQIVSQPGASLNLPVKVEIDSRDIGGPSAGLMFALTITDLLDPVDLAKGRPIAGTGTVGCSGLVGPVGGVVQKTYAAEDQGAKIFLVPEAERADACRIAKKMKIIGITSLEDARRVLLEPAFAAERGCKKASK